MDAVASLAAIPVVGAPTPSTQGWATSAMVQRRLAEIVLSHEDPLIVAVPLLREHLAPGAAVLVDDANRKDERAMVQRWCAETGATVVATDQIGSGWAQLQLP